MNFNIKNNEKVGIVAHDAGASNLIKAWTQNQKNIKFYFCLKGPAINIFKDELSINNNLSIEDLIKNCNLFITGTSYISSHEHQARIRAKKSRILSIAVIDHWVNYQLRFVRNKNMVLPEIIWVFDEFAEEKAKKVFEKTIIQRKRNFYIENLVIKIKNLEDKKIRNKNNVLYLLEPIRKKSNKFYSLYEFEVLDFFVNNLNKLNLPENFNVRFRLHPSETKEKYHEWISKYCRNNFLLSENKSLEEDLAWSNIVVGYESYALVIASATQKRCITSKLPDHEKCRLKIANLEYLRDIK